LVLYFHGGGFVSVDLRVGDWMCGTVARDLDAVVVSIEYRLAPEHPFPAGLDDCYAGLLWTVEHAVEFGADPRRLGVMGESAGGNLAAVVALMARDAGAPIIAHQALLYPTTGAGDTESRRANADAYILTAADMQRYGELYGGDRTNWRVSPLRATSLEGLPPTLIAVAGHDPLHDDGVLYAEALRAAGVEVRLLDFSTSRGLQKTRTPGSTRSSKPSGQRFADVRRRPHARSRTGRTLEIERRMPHERRAAPPH